MSILTKEIHDEAMAEAKRVSLEKYNEYGDRLPCGFAWVSVYVNGNTKLGKSFKALGFKKDFSKAYELWDPSGLPVQSVDIKEAGARAYVKVLHKYLPHVEIFASSRLD
jgi:hypothetical protein